MPIEDLLHSGEGLCDDLPVALTSGNFEDLEDRLPPALDVVRQGENDVKHAADHKPLHLNTGRVLDSDFERIQEVGLEAVVAQLFLLQELDTELAQGVNHEECNLVVWV
jgi:hypothetical protein